MPLGCQRQRGGAATLRTLLVRGIGLIALVFNIASDKKVQKIELLAEVVTTAATWRNWQPSEVDATDASLWQPVTPVIRGTA